MGWRLVVTGMKRLVVLFAAAATLGCTPARVAPAAPATMAAGSELPDGAGRKILQASCTSCHGLREVTKFRGYYTRAQWHDIVVTMVEYGADVDEKDVEVLADYLVEHLGKK
jgi:cytochrome c5